MIYFKIRTFKIQVTQNQWLEILKFIGEITQNEENADIDYIFRFLLHSDAFEFCATATDIVNFFFFFFDYYLTIGNRLIFSS